MATRRAHHKSRLGCQNCKRRRIKCDTKHPTCANCDKRDERCSFLALAPSTRLTAPSPPTGLLTVVSVDTKAPDSNSTESQALVPRSSASPALHLTPLRRDVVLRPLAQSSDSSIDSDETFSFERPSLYTTDSPSQPTLYPSLRLNDTWRDIREVLPPSLREVLLHFEFTTSLTLATDDPAKFAWQFYLPEMAKRHDFLVNTVLSVGSLHLARLNASGSESKRLNDLAASRMNKALLTYRPELSRISPDNAGALFASATLTAVYLFRTSTMDMAVLRSSVPPDTVVPARPIVEKMLSCIFRTIWGLRGPLAVLHDGWDWVVNGEMNPVAARKWWPSKRVPATPRAILEDARLQTLETLWQDADSVPKSNRTHLSSALYLLREAFALVSQLTLPGTYTPMAAVAYAVDDTDTGVLTDRGAIFVWATRISREFMALIEAEDRYALVVLAHYAILPGRVRSVWWMEGLGRDMVIAIAMALGEENWSLIEWPAQVLEVDLWNVFRGHEQGEATERLPGEMRMDVI